MGEFDAVTAALEGGIASTEDVENLRLAILRALLVPGGGHAGAKNLPAMLKVARKMAGADSSQWSVGVSELRKLWFNEGGA